MTKFYNNVKSRLNKKGINGFTKADYLEAAEQLEIVDLDDVTTEQILDGVELLESKRSSQVGSAIAPTTAQTLVHHQETETLIQDETEDEGVQAIAPSEYDQAGELATVKDKSELVASTAQSMGIELQLSEIQNIASNMDYSGDSLSESIADIRAAITTFVEYKAQINQQKINHMITEVRATVTQRNKETSQRLNNGLSQIANDIKEANTDFKSQVKSALQCFAIPANKTS
jgi:uncharacterized protein YukE